PPAPRTPPSTMSADRRHGHARQRARSSRARTGSVALCAWARNQNGSRYIAIVVKPDTRFTCVPDVSSLSRTFYAGTRIEGADARRRKEAYVTDNSRAIAATLVGAVVGALAGFVLFSEQGRAFRRRFDIALDEFAREINSFEGTVNKATFTANEGWRAVT